MLIQKSCIHGQFLAVNGTHIIEIRSCGGECSHNCKTYVMNIQFITTIRGQSLNVHDAHCSPPLHFPFHFPDAILKWLAFAGSFFVLFSRMFQPISYIELQRYIRQLKWGKQNYSKENLIKSLLSLKATARLT